MIQALDTMCRQVRTVFADPAICPRDRHRALSKNPEWRRVGESAEGKAIAKAVEGAPRKDHYAAILTLANEAGQPAWRCDEMRFLLEGEASSLTPADGKRLLRDLDNLCRIVGKNNREVADPSMRAQITAQEASKDAGCAFREMQNALAGVSPSDRYAQMRAMAADAGQPDWRCPALASEATGD